MKLRILFLTLTIIIFNVSQVCAHPQIVREDGNLNLTLCQDDEDIYFNAQLKNGKIVSLCARQHHSPDTGYVKYRYGVGNNIELEYPYDNNPPRGRFLTYHVILSPSLQGHWVYFYIGDNRYLLSSFDNDCLVSVYDMSLIEGRKLFLERCEMQSSILGFTQTSGLLLGEREISERFPVQNQDPTEPQFHGFDD